MNDKVLGRIHQLAERLERRSRQCPGLFLLESRDEFMAVARHQQQEGAEALALALETFDRHPERCHQAVNQWLLAHGQSGSRITGPSVDEYRETRQSIRQALKSTCQSSRASAA
jgi:hypothetical protein